MFQRRLEGRPTIATDELLDALPILVGIVTFSVLWTMIWTRYFKESG